MDPDTPMLIVMVAALALIVYILLDIFEVWGKKK